MAILERRSFLAIGAAALSGRAAEAMPAETQPAPAPVGLDLGEFQPRSMLHVPESKVPRSRFPVIDVHTHLTFSVDQMKPPPAGEGLRTIWPPGKLLPVMDRKNIQTMVNLTGGAGAGLEEAIRDFDRTHPGRFLTFVEPRWNRAAERDYGRFQADDLERSQRAGARGLKVTKTLGLYLRQQTTSGPLVKIDDRRFDPMWDAAGILGLPVAIHISDPEAFFLPTDRFNERFEELKNHPDWSFHGRDFPSNRELLEARNRVFARHQKTQFLTLHVGNDAENLAYVAECMDRFPNMWVELGARIGELGRQPRTSRKFFERYQDRILFGTDAIPDGYETPQQVFVDELYEIYYRFLETDDEYFDYAPAPIPPQGRWRIYGLGLPEQILRKVYHDNAARLLKIS